MDAEQKKSTILIVDDELLSVELLKNMLMEEHDVLLASSAREAFDVIAGRLPDLILMDILMPDMNGYEACYALKSNPRTAEIPVLFISVLSEAESELHGLSIGAADYIIKPFNPTLVRLRVKNHLQLKHQRDMLSERAAQLQQLNTDLAAEVAERCRIQEEHERVISKLREANAQVRTLSSLLPICSACRKVRDDKGYWNQIESFVKAHMNVEFSHGLCVECARSLYPDYCGTPDPPDKPEEK